MSFKKDEMLIMPAVDIKDGKCVQLVQGEPGSEMVKIDNPELVAKHWEKISMLLTYQEPLMVKLALM